MTLWEDSHESTGRLLTENLGFRVTGEEGDRFRYETGPGGSSAIVDVIAAPNSWQGMMAAGSVHHVAWRTPDADQQGHWREELAGAGLNVTPGSYYDLRTGDWYLQRELH